MSWLDAALLALRSLARRPGPNLLTVLAVGLGSALLVALGTIAAAADTRVVGRLSQGGPADSIRVAAAAPTASQLDSDSLKAGAAVMLDDARVAQLRRLPHVSAVIPFLASPALVVSSPGVDSFTTLVGVDLVHSDALPVTILAGRLPAPGSLTEVAITLGYLDELHAGRAEAGSFVGRELEFATPRVEADGPIRYRGRWFRALIVGVIVQDVGDGDFLAPIEQTRLAREWALGGTADGEQTPLPTSPYSGALVTVTDLSRIHAVRAEIIRLGFANSAPEHLVATVLRYLHIIDIVLGAIGSVAIAIACLAIANSLLAAGRERRREIGILKAIGARHRDIRRWFLFEALIVGTIGGVIGTTAGIGIAEIIAATVDGYLVSIGQAGVDLGAIPAWIPLAGVAGTALLAVIAGLVPAEVAARRAPQEAVSAQ